MSGIMVTGAVSEGAAGSSRSPFKKAIKDYQDKMLTGLTDDERKEIEAKVAEYRKKCIEAGMGEKALQVACENYYKSLLREYGAKFLLEFDSASASAKGEASAAQVNEGTATDLEIKTDASKSAEADAISKSGLAPEIKTDPDGTVYLIIASPNGINMKIKIGTDGNIDDDLVAEAQKKKNSIGVMDYEKNNDAFFDEKSKTSFSS